MLHQEPSSGNVFADLGLPNADEVGKYVAGTGFLMEH